MIDGRSIRRAGALFGVAMLGSLFAWSPGCAGAEPRDLSSAARQSGAPPALQRACQLADRRCSRCHPIDRVMVAGVLQPADWSDYVRRMRLTPGSGITAREEPVIIRCLVVQRSSGEQASR
jgi:hypothetical protein